MIREQTSSESQDGDFVPASGEDFLAPMVWRGLDGKRLCHFHISSDVLHEHFSATQNSDQANGYV